MPDDDADEGLTGDDIAEILARPKKATGDNGSIEERSADEIIALDRYQASKRAGRGIKITQIIPGDGPG